MASINLITSFGSAGSGNDEFSSPSGISVSDEYIYVADKGNSRLKVMYSSTFKLKMTRTIAPGPQGVSHFKDGYVAVCNPTQVRFYNDVLVLSGQPAGTFNDLLSMYSDKISVYIYDYGFKWIRKVGFKDTSQTAIKVLDSSNSYGHLTGSKYTDYVYIIDTANSILNVYKKSNLELAYTQSSLPYDFMLRDKYFLYFVKGDAVYVHNDGDFSLLDSFTFSGRNFYHGCIHRNLMYLIDLTNSQICVFSLYEKLDDIVPGTIRGVSDMKQSQDSVGSDAVIDGIDNMDDFVNKRDFDTDEPKWRE